MAAAKKKLKPARSYATIRQAQRQINKLQPSNPGCVYHVLHHPKETGRYCIGIMAGGVLLCGYVT